MDTSFWTVAIMATTTLIGLVANGRDDDGDGIDDGQGPDTPIVVDPVGNKVRWDVAGHSLGHPSWVIKVEFPQSHSESSLEDIRSVEYRVVGADGSAIGVRIGRPDGTTTGLGIWIDGVRVADTTQPGNVDGQLRLTLSSGELLGSLQVKMADGSSFVVADVTIAAG